MNVRKIEEGDLEKLVSLYKHLHPEDIVPKRKELQNSWNAINSSDCFQYFIIEKDNLIVATCNLTIIPNLTQGARPFGVIENVVTHSDFQNQGLGTIIMEHAIAYARSMNCYKIMLLSNSQRKGSHKFYKKLGFKSDAKTGFVLQL